MADEIVTRPGAKVIVSMPETWSPLDVMTLSGRVIPITDGDTGQRLCDLALLDWDIRDRIVRFQIDQVYNPFPATDLDLFLEDYVIGG